LSGDIKFSVKTKWELEEYQNLSPEAGYLLYYLNDRCDTAGFIQYNPKHFAYFTRIPEEKIEPLMQEIQKYYWRENKWLWLKDHIEDQRNAPINLKKTVHKAICRNIQQRARDFDIDKILRYLNVDKDIFQRALIQKPLKDTNREPMDTLSIDYALDTSKSNSYRQSEGLSTSHLLDT